MLIISSHSCKFQPQGLKSQDNLFLFAMPIKWETLHVLSSVIRTDHLLAHELPLRQQHVHSLCHSTVCHWTWNRDHWWCRLWIGELVVRRTRPLLRQRSRILFLQLRLWELFVLLIRDDKWLTTDENSIFYRAYPIIWHPGGIGKGVIESYQPMILKKKLYKAS